MMTTRKKNLTHRDPATTMDVVVFLIGLVLIIFFGIFIGTHDVYDLGVQRPSEQYAKSGVVTDVDTEADVVTFVDTQGNAWTFTGCEDWQVGDRLAVIMNTQGTESIYDDVIMGTPHYEG